MLLQKTTPIVRILDETKAKAFYVDYLGFTIDWEHRFAVGMPLYMQVSRDDCILHLSMHTGDCETGTAMRIEAGDLEAFQKELAAKATGKEIPRIETPPWGTQDMNVRDPFGNRMTFTSAICT